MLGLVLGECHAGADCMMPLAGSRACCRLSTPLFARRAPQVTSLQEPRQELMIVINDWGPTPVIPRYIQVRSVFTVVEHGSSERASERERETSDSDIYLELYDHHARIR